MKKLLFIYKRVILRSGGVKMFSTRWCAKNLLIILSAILIFNMCGCAKTKQNQNLNIKKTVSGTNYSNAKIAWGFKKNKNAPPDIPESYKDVLKRFDGYYLGNDKGKYLYLTFDEGYENGYTSKILDILKKTKTPAAFFITGPYLKTEENLVKRMVSEGHIVGNHTVNHPSMPKESDEEIVNELSELNDKFSTLTGQKMKYMRPPMGEFSERTLAITKNAGYKTILWSSAYEDWNVNKQRGTDFAIKKITDQFHNGNIILLHAVSKDNTNALEKIISLAREQGYTFLSLNDL